MRKNNNKKWRVVFDTVTKCKKAIGFTTRGCNWTLRPWTTKRLSKDPNDFERILKRFGLKKDSQFWDRRTARLVRASTACQMSTRSGPSNNRVWRIDSSCNAEGELLTFRDESLEHPQDKNRTQHQILNQTPLHILLNSGVHFYKCTYMWQYLFAV